MPVADRSAPPHPYLAAAPSMRPRLLAHRGLVTPQLGERGVADNTQRAFDAAVEAGAEYIETDCHLTADGEVVLLHDADLARVAGDPRRVADISRRELSAIMSDRGGLVTLAEALSAFPGVRFNLDVKAPAAAWAAGRIVSPHADRVLLTSFSDSTRRAALAAAATVPGASRPATSPGRDALIRVLLAVRSGSKRLVARALSGLDALQIPEWQGRIRVLTPQLITAAHAAGVEVHVWTVNDPDRMRSLVGMGVDGIVTDRADLALKAMPAARG